MLALQVQSRIHLRFLQVYWKYNSSQNAVKVYKV